EAAGYGFDSLAWPSPRPRRLPWRCYSASDRALSTSVICRPWLPPFDGGGHLNHVRSRRMTAQAVTARVQVRRSGHLGAYGDRKTASARRTVESDRDVVPVPTRPAGVPGRHAPRPQRPLPPRDRG